MVTFKQLISADIEVLIKYSLKPVIIDWRVRIPNLTYFLGSLFASIFIYSKDFSDHLWFAGLLSHFFHLFLPASSIYLDHFLPYSNLPKKSSIFRKTICSYFFYFQCFFLLLPLIGLFLEREKYSLRVNFFPNFLLLG